MTLTISIMTLATILFVGYSLLEFGITTSISATTYLHDKGKVWIFWLWLWIIAVGMVIEMPNLWGVMACSGFATTGLTLWHNRKNKLQSWVHTIGTLIAITATFIALWVGYGLWEYSAIMAVGGGLLYVWAGKNKIYYIECLAIVLALIGLLSK